MNKEKLKEEIRSKAEELNDLLGAYVKQYKLEHIEKSLFNDLAVALAEITVPEIF